MAKKSNKLTTTNTNSQNNQTQHKCNSLPILGEEHNWDTQHEYFNDAMFSKLMTFSKEFDHDPYNTDYESSIQFINSLKIPEDQEVMLTKEPGCLMCHNELIPPEVHYAMIKGLCDIQTIQYYLFSKSIFYKLWYIKKHQEHIWVHTPITRENKLEVDDIVYKQIEAIHSNILQEQEFNDSKSKISVNNLRKQLKEYIELYRNIPNKNNDNSSKSVSFEKIIDLTKSQQGKK